MRALEFGSLLLGRNIREFAHDFSTFREILKGTCSEEDELQSGNF